MAHVSMVPAKRNRQSLSGGGSFRVIGTIAESPLAAPDFPRRPERLTPAEWDRSGEHSESGPYSVDRWLRIYAEHSHDHADQIRRARRGED
jgi:hypothetical protein